MNRAASLADAVAALGRPLLLAFDVDGTLAPIVENPDLAAVPEQTLSALSGLARLPGIEVALITGRDFASLSRMEQLEGVWRGVEHGGVVLGPGEAPSAPELSAAQQDALAEFRRWVEEHASDAFIEYKPAAIAVHVRRIASSDAARAERLLKEADELASRLGLHVRRGKGLREAEAARYDKGTALFEIFERTGARSMFFAGDDLTDLPAIELASRHGMGAFVRSDERPDGEIGSALVFDGVDEVALFLSELGTRLGG